MTNPNTCEKFCWDGRKVRGVFRVKNTENQIDKTISGATQIAANVKPDLVSPASIGIRAPPIKIPSEANAMRHAVIEDLSFLSKVISPAIAP